MAIYQNGRPIRKETSLHLLQRQTLQLNRTNFDIPYPFFSQQVSVDQTGEEKGKIRFTNGVCFSSLGVESRQLTINSKPGERVLCSFEPMIAHWPTNPARHPEYTDYNQRLGSYARWPLTKPDAISLCDAGFFFSNYNTLVRCIQCAVGFNDFSEGDDPLLEHVRHTPNCPSLVKYLRTKRLSAIKGSMVKTLNAIVLRSCSFRDLRILTSEQGDIFLAFTRKRCYDEELFTNTDSNFQCRHPEYNTVQSRLHSFAGWPRHTTQTPLHLAEAGFYYTGFEDQVRCFMCDGGLRRWDPEDVPWTEHCRWFPKCQFTRETKAKEFIDLVQPSIECISWANENSINDQQMQNSTNTMSQMTLRDPKLKAAIVQKPKGTCPEISFQLTDINAVVEESRLIKMDKRVSTTPQKSAECFGKGKHKRSCRSSDCEISLIKELIHLIEDTLKTATDIMSLLVERRPQWFPDLTREPTEKDLLIISEAVGENNRVLGLALGLSDAKLDQISLDSQTTVLKTYNMLREWRAKNQQKSLSSLIETMKSCHSVTIDWNQIKKVYTSLH